MYKTEIIASKDMSNEEIFGNCRVSNINMIVTLSKCMSLNALIQMECAIDLLKSSIHAMIYAATQGDEELYKKFREQSEESLKEILENADAFYEKGLHLKKEKT